MSGVGTMERVEVETFEGKASVPCVQGSRQVGRNRAYDLVRIAFATLVLLSHAPELMDGNELREPLSRWAHVPLSFGTVGLDGFFLLSGYLMVQSWLRDPSMFNFVQKRVLRIVPGYVVAATLSIVMMGLLAPGMPLFFRHLNWTDVQVSMLLLGPPDTPAVTPGQHYHIVNGAMWSIAYEFRCYMLLAMLGWMGVLKRSAALVAGTAALWALALTPGWVGHVGWQGNYSVRVLGYPTTLAWFGAIYLTGSLFYVFRERIAYRPLFTAMAVVGIVVVARVSPVLFERTLILLGGYLLFSLSHLRLRWMERLHWLPDISYGVYLYGWPVESLLIYFLHGSPWMIFVLSVPLSFALGWLSWEGVESPMLRRKRLPQVALGAEEN